MARHLATIGPVTVWLHGEPRTGKDGVVVGIRMVNESGMWLSLDESVELARLLVKTAAQHGYGSDEDRERLIAWAQVKK